MGGNHLAFAPKLYRLELQSRILRTTWVFGHMIRILELMALGTALFPKMDDFVGNSPIG